MKTSIKKSILNVLSYIDAQYSSSLSSIEKKELIRDSVKKLRKNNKTSLQIAYLLLKENKTLLEEEESTLLNFKLKVISKTIEEKEKEPKKLPMERNYAESPLFSATHPTAKRLVMLRNEHGEIIEERVGYRKIQYVSKQGEYLTSFDYRVFAGIQKMWELKGGKQTFSFTFKELCDEIELFGEGGIYQQIEESLIRLATTSIIMYDYQDPQLKKIMKTSIHNIIYDAEIDRLTTQATIKINDYLQKGLEENNFITINLSIFQNLSTVTGKLLYPLLRSLIRDENTFEIDRLVTNLGLVNKERKALLKTLRVALEDLMQSGIIESFEFLKSGRAYKFVRIIPTHHFMEALDEGITLSQ